jgi:hypothetical protein
LAKESPIASKVAVFFWSGKGRYGSVQSSGFNIADLHRSVECLTLNVEPDRLLSSHAGASFPDHYDSAMSLENAIIYLKLLARALLFLCLAASYGLAQDRGGLREFLDEEFGYRFLYLADWKLERLPEGKANPGMRVRLQGSGGSSFVVIVERTGQPLSKVEFETDPQADKRIEAMMRQTLEQTYRAISKSLGALEMKIGERHNLTDDYAIKYYLATLNRMKTGSAVIVAGTHVYPFSKDYSINFIMTAFQRGKPAEIQILTAVFNSFALLDSAAPPPKAP